MAERKRRRSCHVELDEIGCDRICMKHWPTALSVGSGRHFSYFLTRPITNRRITAPMYLRPGGLGIEQYVRDAAWYPLGRDGVVDGLHDIAGTGHLNRAF
jgi:hypothetical protein